MSKLAFLRARLEPNLKIVAELELQIPKDETKIFFEETDQEINQIDSTNIEDLFRKIGI